MQSLHPADDEPSCIDLGFTEVTGEGEEVEVSDCESVLELAAEWAALVGDGLTGCVVDFVPQTTTLTQIPTTIGGCPTTGSSNTESSQTITTTLPPALPDPLCIHHRLKDLYSQQLIEPFPLPNQHIRPTSFLLKRLLQENTFNMVVITLYPLNKGYTISLRTITGNEFQESVQPYSQNLLLDYINNEQLPPIFLEYWETTFPQMFYTGCVLVEIKDGRICEPPVISHTLLKPTTQSLMNDVAAILLSDTSNSTCSSDLRIALEGSIVNNIQTPLLLDPSKEVGRNRCNRYHLRKAMLTKSLNNKTSFQNEIKNHYNTKFQNCRKKGKQHLYDYITKKKCNATLPKPVISISASPNKIIHQNPWNGSIEAACNVSSLARLLERPRDTSDNTPEIVEQYILETDHPPLSTTYHIRLTILQRPTNSEYLGTLYVDKEYLEGCNNGSLCRFTLGSRANASRYIKQFTEIFTEEGRKSVRITHLVPGKPARVTYTAAMMEREGKLAANLRIHNHTKTVVQVNKHAIHNPAISALANSFRNSVHQYQQQAAVAAAATSNTTSNNITAHREVGTIIGNMVGNIVENVNLSGVNLCTTPIRHPTNQQNTTVLTLLNKSGVGTQTNAGFLQQTTVQQQQQQQQQQTAQQQQQQHKLVARKMTISNLVGSRLRPVTTNNCPSIRIPLSTIANQLVPNPHQPELQVRPDQQPLQQTISVQAYGSHFHQLTGVNLKGLKTNSTGVRSFVTNSTTSPAVQTLHMISTAGQDTVPQTGQQSNQVGSSLSLTLPGLSALLADIESDA